MEGLGELETRIPARLSAAEGRRFGLTVGAALLVLAAISLWRHRSPQAVVFGALGAGLLVAGLTVPTRLGPLFRAWMGLAHAMSRVTTPLVMGFLYFVVLTPVGLLMRLFGRRPLERSRALASGWIERAPDTRQRADMARQF